MSSFSWLQCRHSGWGNEDRNNVAAQTTITQTAQTTITGGGHRRQLSGLRFWKTGERCSGGDAARHLRGCHSGVIVIRRWQIQGGPFLRKKKRKISRNQLPIIYECYEHGEVTNVENFYGENVLGFCKKSYICKVIRRACVMVPASVPGCMSDGVRIARLACGQVPFPSGFVCRLVDK